MRMSGRIPCPRGSRRRVASRAGPAALAVGLWVGIAALAGAAWAQGTSSDNKPYDDRLMRLSEILGAVHYLRELCGAEEGQIWRDQMKEILRNEGTTAVRRAKLVNAFNDGYRGYRRTYRTCTQSATLATTRFSTEGATIAASLAQGSTVAAKGTAEAKSDAGEPGAQPAPEGAEAVPADSAAPDADQTGGLPPAEGQAMAPAPAPDPAAPEAAPADEPSSAEPSSEEPNAEEPPD